MDDAHEQPLVNWTYLIYGLHALSLIGFIFEVAILVGAFVSGPSFLAVILNYVKRRDVRGTWLESHFRWQIRTFWYGLLWFSTLLPWATDRTFARFVVALGLRALGPVLGALFLTISLAAAMFIASLPLGVLPCAEYQQRQLSTGSIGNVLTCAAVRIVSLWFLYRIGRGWLAVNNHQPMDQ